MTEALLDLVFPHGPPPLLAALLPERWDPRRFNAGPIFTSAGPRRFYVASDGHTEGWDEAVCQAAPAAAGMLRGAPAGVRRMVDTDGARIDVYLDDLHMHGGGSDVMCETVEHPSGARSQLRFLDVLPGGAAHLAGLWGVGRLLQRSGDRSSLLWITEAKYTGRCEEVDILAARLLDVPGGYWRLQERWPGAYIDGVEIHPDGSVDLTPGFR